jgi:hypothetical protein
MFMDIQRMIENIGRLQEQRDELQEMYRDAIKTIRERDLCIDITQKENQKLTETLDEVCFKASEHAGFIQRKLEASQAREKILLDALEQITLEKDNGNAEGYFGTIASEALEKVK